MTDEAELWRRYHAAGTADAREPLILHYAPLVKYVAGRVAANLPPTVEKSDLVSYGLLGLIDAIERFDPSLGYRFSTYAVPRIRGAIIDELRTLDWAPRSVRARARQLEAALATLEAELKRSPTDEELADELGWTLEELRTALERNTAASIVALDQTVDRGAGPVPLIDTLHDLTAQLPDERAVDADTHRVLRETIGQLTEREQTVLALYYFEGMTVAQVGDVLGVTESRISQIHTKAVMALRVLLERQTAA